MPVTTPTNNLPGLMTSSVSVKVTELFLLCLFLEMVSSRIPIVLICLL